MSTVSTLLVNLKASTASFTKGMKRGRKSLSSFGALAGKIGTATARGFAVIGGAAIAAGVALSFPIKNAMSAIDNIAKMSSELGISTEALSGWEHAAKITGSSLQDLHKGLQIMTRRLGEAKQGYGEGKKGLEALGLSVDKVANMGGEEAFTLIADKISKLENVTDKVSVAYSLFGRQGVQMLNTLNLGADGLAELRAEADKLGITFSAVDARAIEEANDSIQRLKSLFQGVINSLAIALAPYIKYVSDHLIQMGQSGGGATEWISNKMQGLVKVIDIVLRAIDGIKGAFHAVGAAVYKTISFIAKGFNGLINLIAKGLKAIGKNDLAEKLQGSFASSMGKGIEEEFNNMASDKWGKATENFSKAFGEGSVDAINKELEDNRKNIELGLGKNPLATEGLDLDAKKKTKSKTDALSYSSKLIDVKAMAKGAGGESPELKEAKKQTAAQQRTALNTERIAKQNEQNTLG